jgi:hypothetical protein
MQRTWGCGTGMWHKCVLLKKKRKCGFAWWRFWYTKKEEETTIMSAFDL